MSSDSLRQYQPIWIGLKTLAQKDAETKGISITAPRPLHKRIVKAVVKEKWLDAGWKLQIEPEVSELTFVQRASILTFFLTRKKYDGRMMSFTENSF